MIVRSFFKTALKFTVFFLSAQLFVGLIYAQDKNPELLADREQKRKQVESSPEDLDKHRDYLRSFNKADSQLVNKQYAILMQRFPSSATIPYAMAKFFYYSEDPRAKNYLLKAVSIKPDLAEAWSILAIDALFWGDYKLSDFYTEKAALADRNNPKYTYNYLSNLRKTDKLKYDSLALDLVLRFPTDNYASRVLADMAYNEENPVIKEAYYEQLYSRFSESQPDGFKGGMSQYLNYLIASGAPEKGYALALKMVLDKQKRNGLEWKFKIKTARSYVQLKDLMNEKKYDEALKLLSDIKVVDNLSASYVGDRTSFLLLNARLLDLTGKTQLAYDTLFTSYAIARNNILLKPMMTYASKLGIDSTKINDQLQSLREAKAVAADDFTLLEYGTLKKVSLSDYKGKVVLLTYWFPGCGPCRAEFPHFENVLKKFNSADVVYLGINGYPNQDDFVLPFMKKTGYSFVALKEDNKRSRGNLIAHGYPSNYLIDRDGMIVHSDFKIGRDQEQDLELIIKEVLAKK